MDCYESDFREALLQKYNNCEKHLIPKEVYYKIIDELKTVSQTSTSKSRQIYYNLKKFEVLQCGDVEKLIKRRKSPDERPVYFVTIEDTYDIIKRAHIATGHGGRDKMVKNLGPRYANITKESVELFKSYCQVCQEKRKRPKITGVVVKPILSKEFNSRGQVDLIDMQSSAQGPFKWIMVYQCHLTKFVVLRPLTSKRASEVAYQLLDIFLLFGAPAILQSDNGSEFTAQVIKELKVLWSELIMVHGKPRHPQSQGSVERANGDIKDILVAWMTDNNTQDWTVGLKFTQQQKNCSHHAGIKQTPYKAMFGEDPKVGLTYSTLPTEMLERLQSEDDLIAICKPAVPIITQSQSETVAAVDQPPQETETIIEQPLETVAIDDQSPPETTYTIVEQPHQETVAIIDQPTLATAATVEQPPPDTEGIIDQPPLATAATVEQPPQDTVVVVDQPPQETVATVNQLQPVTSVVDQPLPETIATVDQHSLGTVATVDQTPNTEQKSCPIDERMRAISIQRKRASESQILQAERMIKRSRVDFKSGEIGDNVAIPISLVDRGRGDPRNILGVILDRNDQDMYRIAVKSGVISARYSRNQFDLCPQRILTESDVTTDCVITLRQAVKTTASGGQGFFHCDCKQSNRQCQTKKCKCFKADRLCNSRCHSSLTCKNKQ